MADRDTAGSIDEYIAGFPPETQTVLEEVRVLIRGLAPDAVETISYAIPTFDLSGKHLVHFAGYEHHIGLYPTPSGMAEFEADLAPLQARQGLGAVPARRASPHRPHQTHRRVQGAGDCRQDREIGNDLASVLLGGRRGCSAREAHHDWRGDEGPLDGAVPGRRRNGLRRLLLGMMAVLLVLTVGCTQGGGGSSSDAPDATGAATASVDPAPRPASIPTMEFVPVAELPEGTKVKRGMTLKPGSYKSAVDGEHVISVQWVLGEDDGINRPMLSLEFDETGKRDFAGLINNVADKDVLFVLNGTVIGPLAIHQSVLPGAITLGSPEIPGARSDIDAATVPSQ